MDGEELTPTTPPAQPAGRPRGITAAQRRRLFARAHELGFNVDDLRAMTPAGSVSVLTLSEAAWLIDQLEAGPDASPPTREAGTGPTARQYAMIAWLSDAIGFNGTQFNGWLAKRFNVFDLAEIPDRRTASRIIGGLMGMKRSRDVYPWKGSKAESESAPPTADP